MWNQESHLDHLALLPAIPRPFFSPFNNEVARVPFYDGDAAALADRVAETFTATQRAFAP